MDHRTAVCVWWIYVWVCVCVCVCVCVRAMRKALNEM